MDDAVKGARVGISPLLSSGYDFVEHSLEIAREARFKHPDRWKFAIVAIATSVELFVKERLRREHPILIYTKVDDAKGHTVSLEQALKRLNGCRVSIDAEDARRLTNARDLRNSIIHFSTEATATQLQAAYIDLLEFAHVFHEKELGQDLHAQLNTDLWEVDAWFIEKFRREFIEYQGSTIHRSFPSELVEAQYLELWYFGVDSFPRIPYAGVPDSPELGCHDCAALPGQLHVPWCDMEECPRCGGQALGCECNELDKEALPRLPEDESE